MPVLGVGVVDGGQQPEFGAQAALIGIGAGREAQDVQGLLAAGDAAGQRVEGQHVDDGAQPLQLLAGLGRHVVGRRRGRGGLAQRDAQRAEIHLQGDGQGAADQRRLLAGRHAHLQSWFASPRPAGGAAGLQDDRLAVAGTGLARIGMGGDGLQRQQQHHRAGQIADIHLAAGGQGLDRVAERAGAGNGIGLLQDA
ncbi:MAG: hypothetical protein HQL40_09825 [Alphaproteobacteria bacterium]|nr:hypothetical protein [Alphaproteobacteria bacterium]